MAEHPSFKNNDLPPGEPVLGRTYRADGWAYVEMDAWSKREWWDRARALFGEEEYYLLAESNRGDLWRGQFLLSPAGQDRFMAMRAREKGSLH